MTDVELDARVTALEENGGVSPENGIHTSTSFFYQSFLQLKRKLMYLTFFKF